MTAKQTKYCYDCKDFKENCKICSICRKEFCVDHLSIIEREGYFKFNIVYVCSKCKENIRYNQ